MRYKALECVYAATIKYVGTVFGLLAADLDPNLKAATWTPIFDSSSLGGWLDAVASVCARSKRFSDRQKSFCDYFSLYKKHPSRETLDDITRNLRVVVEELRRLGYQLDNPRSLSLRRTLELTVTIRNKCAHGALDPLFFSRIESAYAKALMLTLSLIPFPEFVFWGSHGRNSIQFVESPPKYQPRLPYSMFWAESDLLSTRFTHDIPFLLYRDETRSIYCLNDNVTADSPSTEYIDYTSGHVISRDVVRPGHTHDTPVPQSIRPRAYHDYVPNLRRKFVWLKIEITTTAVDSCPEAVGVYMFTANVPLGSKEIEVVLYVGRTTNLRGRLRSYLRIFKGYDDRRPELSYMFETYRDSLSLFFCGMRQAEIAKVEKAIYETTMPDFNIVSPATK